MSTTPIVHHAELSLSSSLSSLSISSSNQSEEVDWDRSLTDIDVTPSTPTRTEGPNPYLSQVECTPSGKSGRSLCDILQQHADKTTGRDDTQSLVSLTADEERVLEEELGRWINSDLSPYEPEVHHGRSASLDGLKLIRPSGSSNPRQRANSVTPAGSPKLRNKALAS